MLWSLIKIILFMAGVAAATYGIIFLTETDGGIRVAIGTLEFNLAPLQSVIALILFVVAIWIALKLLSLGVAVLKFLNGDETALSRWSDRTRERRGYEALTEGLMALASGEGRTAMTKAAKAERYLKRPDLTNLITAQAAEMTGDTKKAQQVYRELLSDEKTRFVGVRGIMKQKLQEGDTDTAMKLAEKAFALKPKHEETQDVLLKLQAGAGDWTGARKTLGAKLKSGGLPRDVHRRRDAVLALGEAKDIVADGASIDAQEAAIEANRLSPDLVPAAVMAAEKYIEQDKPRYATRVIKKAWAAGPHPDLAAAFAAIAPDETPAARIKRFDQLLVKHPGETETKLLKAELFIAAERYGDARKALGDLAETDPTARSLTIMAAIERGEGSPDSVVKGYLAKAVTASRGPQWVCDSCQNIPGSWVPACPNCGAFDSLTWRVPTTSETVQVAGSAMMPLIVGPEADPDVDVAEETTVTDDTPSATEDTSEASHAEDHAPTDETAKTNGVDPSPAQELEQTAEEAAKAADVLEGEVITPHTNGTTKR